MKKPASHPIVQVQGSLPVAVFKERKTYIAYTPVLDLTAQGKSLKEVEKNFEEVFQIYLEETLTQGTLERDLRKHGWSKRKQSGWAPPSISVLSEQHSKNMQLKAFVMAPFPSAVRA